MEGGKWKAIKVFKGLLIHSFKPSQTKHCETQLKSEYITKFKQKAPFTLYPACIHDVRFPYNLQTAIFLDLSEYSNLFGNKYIFDDLPNCKCDGI